MSGRLRKWLLGGSAACIAALVAVSVIARLQSSTDTAQARISAPLAIGTELQRPRQVPDVPLVNAAGQRTSLAAFHGKWVVLAPSMTLCTEVCPITTGALIQLQDELRRDGLTKQVVVAETTVDPWRDSPARLRAYTRLTGANFHMLTGSVADIRRFWKFFGVQFYKVAEGKPADIDWWTHRPLTFDVDHTDALFFISPTGQLRIVDGDTMPDLHGRLKPALRDLLDSAGRHNLAHPQLPWTPAEALDDVDYLMNRTIPAPRGTRAPSASTARRELADSPRPLDAIHAQASRLLSGGAPALMARLKSLRGRYPVVVNAWASWCTACRPEFPLFASASARFGRRVAFLGADDNDPSASTARAFLASHHVSYPSYQTSSTQLSPLAQIQGMPTTIFISRSGHVVHVHISEYQSEASLDNDIERYALGVHIPG